MKRILIVSMILFAISPLIIGITYIEYFQGERAFVHCVEENNKNIMILEYRTIDEGFYFSYAQIPDADYESSWQGVADCQDKYLDGLDLYIQAIVITPIITVDDGLHFIGYVYFRVLFTDENLKHVESKEYIFTNVQFEI